MITQELFILGGMPASGKSTLGKRSTPPSNWPVEGWWQKSMMACDLKRVEPWQVEELPSHLGVEIDFSHIGPDLQPQLKDVGDPLNRDYMRQLNPEFKAVITLWGEPEELLLRFTERSHQHPQQDNVEKIYRSPQLLSQYYSAWMHCVQKYEPDEHWIYDTDKQTFHNEDWLANRLS